MAHAVEAHAILNGQHCMFIIVQSNVLKLSLMVMENICRSINQNVKVSFVCFRSQLPVK